MWPFGKKKTSIYHVTREEEEQDVCLEELPSFAPEISMDGMPKHTIDEELPKEEEIVLTVPKQEDAVEDVVLAEEDQPEELNGAVEEELPEESGSDPGLLFDQLGALPYCSRRYALYNGKIYMAYPDELGGLYLFEEFGEYITVAPEDCAAFARISAISGIFKGKMYTSSDLEYITGENAWPLTVLARNKEQYNTALREEYKPYKRSSDGKSMILAKPISLHRIKELFLKVELTTTQEGEIITEQYIVDITRTDLENLDSVKQYKALMKTLIERILSVQSHFFSVQVLKCKRNLVVCFPLDGNGALGDRFAGGVITDVAQIGDGTVLFKIGNDQDITLPLRPGSMEKGQYRISLD